MKKIAVLIPALVLCILCGCAGGQGYKDGTYSAEYVNFDSRGYKDFMKLTVADGQVTSVVFDSVDDEGGLKSQDSEYATSMDAVQETYPGQFTADLVNQYLDKRDIGQVDVVAGATYSSESFITLFKALEKNMQNGDESLVIIENITEK